MTSWVDFITHSPLRTTGFARLRAEASRPCLNIAETVPCGLQRIGGANEPVPRRPP